MRLNSINPKDNPMEEVLYCFGGKSDAGGTTDDAYEKGSQQTGQGATGRDADDTSETEREKVAKQAGVPASTIVGSGPRGGNIVRGGSDRTPVKAGREVEKFAEDNDLTVEEVNRRINQADRAYSFDPGFDEGDVADTSALDEIAAEFDFAFSPEQAIAQSLEQDTNYSFDPESIREQGIAESLRQDYSAVFNQKEAEKRELGPSPIAIPLDKEIDDFAKIQKDRESRLAIGAMDDAGITPAEDSRSLTEKIKDQVYSAYDAITRGNVESGIGQIIEANKKLAEENRRIREAGQAQRFPTAEEMFPDTDFGDVLDTSLAVPKSEQNLGVLNNNPGNLRFAGQPNATEGFGGFAKFETMEQGRQALENQIALDASRTETLEEFIKGKPDAEGVLRGGYAPASENPSDAYINYLSEQTGIRPDELITETDVDALSNAITRFETGSLGEDYFRNTITDFGPTDQIAGFDIASLEASTQAERAAAVAAEDQKQKSIDSQREMESRLDKLRDLGISGINYDSEFGARITWRDAEAQKNYRESKAVDGELAQRVDQVLREASQGRAAAADTPDLGPDLSARDEEADFLETLGYDYPETFDPEFTGLEMFDPEAQQTRKPSEAPPKTGTPKPDEDSSALDPQATVQRNPVMGFSPYEQLSTIDPETGERVALDFRTSLGGPDNFGEVDFGKFAEPINVFGVDVPNALGVAESILNTLVDPTGTMERAVYEGGVRSVDGRATGLDTGIDLVTDGKQQVIGGFDRDRNIVYATEGNAFNPALSDFFADKRRVDDLSQDDNQQQPIALGTEIIPQSLSAYDFGSSSFDPFFGEAGTGFEAGAGTGSIDSLPAVGTPAFDFMRDFGSFTLSPQAAQAPVGTYSPEYIAPISKLEEGERERLVGLLGTPLGAGLGLSSIDTGPSPIESAEALIKGLSSD